MMPRSAIRILLFLLLYSLLACNRQLPDALIVLPGAKGVEQHYSEGMDQIAYQLQEKYPAEQAINSVKTALAGKGWQPMQYEFMHPDRPTSNLVGWTIFEDKRIGGTRMVYEWLGEWKDKRNNFVRYSFRYADPASKYTHKIYIVRPSTENLIVSAAYIPHELAVSTRKAEEERIKRYQQKK